MSNSNTLESRNPSLIDLPVSLPSVPILSPLLNPLVSGDDSSDSSSSSQVPVPSSTSSSQPAASSHSSFAPSSGTSSNGSNSGSSGSQSSSPQSSDSPNTVHSSSSNANTGASASGSHTNAPSGVTASQGINSAVASTVQLPNSSLGLSATPKFNLASGTPPIANVGPDPTQTITAGGTGAASYHSGTSSTSSSSGNDDGGGLVNSSLGSPASRGLSKGAIAGIVLCSLFIGAVILIIAIRRRFQSRRAARLHHWRGISSDKFDFVSPSNEPTSRRSSFATSYDNSHPRPSSVQSLPEFPAMVELRDTHGPGLLTHTQAVDDFVGNMMGNFDNQNSWSMTRPDSPSHLLVRPPSESLAVALIPPSPTTPTRMSVRPFTPTELFSFPKPPVNLVGRAVDPFADSVHIHEFSEIETVLKPFVPSLDDEIWVEAGDMVRILRIFSDNWALVEKVSNDGGKGSAKALQSQAPGLIPVDCFRRAEPSTKPKRTSSTHPEL